MKPQQGEELIGKNFTPGAFNTPGEYILRIDDAREFRHDSSIEISGTLGAVKQFLDGKKIDEATTHLLIEKDLGQLTLVVGDTNPFTKHEITGTLHRDNILSQFALNTDKRWTVQSFLKFVRTMRYYFADKAQHSKLIESLTRWSAKIEVVLKEHQNINGSSLFELEKKVSGVELVTRFDLQIALFQGYEKEKFTVEIGLDPKSNQVDLYLISDQLIELEAGKRESIINAEIEKFSAYKFSKIIIS